MRRRTSAPPRRAAVEAATVRHREPRIGLAPGIVGVLARPAVAAVAAALTLGLATAAPAEPAARSGIYDNLTVVVAEGGVRGAFFDQRGQSEQGGAPPFSCIFLLRGRLNGDMARVVTWAPGDARAIPGELRFRADGADLRLAAEPGGCGMTSGDMTGRPYAMARGPAGEGWLDVRLVSAGRAVFHRDPGQPAPRAPYVTAFDPVVILERRAGWVRARYLGGARPVTGWLRAGDLAPPDPPVSR